MNPSWWLITISTYGAFSYYGTESEAEEMRRHKAGWEGGIGTKVPVKSDHPEVVRQIQGLRSMQQRGAKLGNGFVQRDVAILDAHPEETGL